MGQYTCYSFRCCMKSKVVVALSDLAPFHLLSLTQIWHLWSDLASPPGQGNSFTCPLPHCHRPLCPSLSKCLVAFSFGSFLLTPSLIVIWSNPGWGNNSTCLPNIHWPTAGVASHVTIGYWNDLSQFPPLTSSLRDKIFAFLLLPFSMLL